MSFVFKPATREQTPLLIGLVGPSGSGKTYSALRLATGIQSVVGGKIAAIDTEARRMLHYADRFKFEYLEFGAAFSSDRYLEALTAAVDTGAKTIIVDSMSHEHEGAGGYLEFQAAELDRMAGDDWRKRQAMNFTAWIKPAGARRRLINGLLQLNANFVFCFRAKEKIKLVKKNGKTEPEDAGWQAIAGEEFVFEMTDRFLLPPGARGVPALDDEAMHTGVPKMPDEHTAILGRGNQLDEEIGASLARWAMGGAPKVERLERTDRHIKMIAELEQEARANGFEAFKGVWEALDRDDRAAIGKNERDRIGAIGHATDEARASEGADA